MNVEAIVDWVDKNTWGSDTEFGDRRTSTRLELERLVRAVEDCVPEGGFMFEVGVYGGRSLAALLMCARELKARVWACDPLIWQENLAEPKLRRMLSQFPDVDYRFYPIRSGDMDREMTNLRYPSREFDLLHIDGDHYNVGDDCRWWLPRLRSGGIVVFHDIVPDPRSPIYEGSYLQAKPYVWDWELLWWATDEPGCQMGRRKP